MIAACVAQCKTVVEVLSPGKKVLISSPDDRDQDKAVEAIVSATRRKFYVSLACTVVSAGAGVLHIVYGDRPDEAARAFDLCAIQGGIILITAVTSEQLREVCRTYCRTEGAPEGERSLGGRVLRAIAEAGSRFLPAPLSFFRLGPLLPHPSATPTDVAITVASGAVAVGAAVQLQPELGRDGCLTCLNCTRATAALLATIGLMAKTITDVVEVAGFVEMIRADRHTEET